MPVNPPASVKADAITPGGFVSTYVRQGQPVVIKGLVDDWKAVRQWTPGYLAEFTAAMGDIGVPYRSTPDAMPRMGLERIHQGTTSLLGILRECEASPEQGREIYVPGLDLPPRMPLTDDIGLPALISDRKIYSTSVFLGRNTRCIGHYHAKSQALLCQVQGIKRVWMYPPAELGRLYPFPAWSPGFFRSQVNFYGDRSQFPRVEKARGELFELHPGDALFIPMHWLHVPEGLGWTVTVTHWWRPGLSEWPLNFATTRTLFGIGCEAARRFGSGIRGKLADRFGH